jgi:hypothetical protein
MTNFPATMSSSMVRAILRQVREPGAGEYQDAYPVVQADDCAPVVDAVTGGLIVAAARKIIAGELKRLGVTQ